MVDPLGDGIVRHFYKGPGVFDPSVVELVVPWEPSAGFRPPATITFDMPNRNSSMPTEKIVYTWDSWSSE